MVDDELRALFRTCYFEYPSLSTTIMHWAA